MIQDLIFKNYIIKDELNNNSVKFLSKDEVNKNMLPVFFINLIKI